VIALLSAIFFGSGVAALLFETLWFRQAGLAFGTSVWAAALVLAGFMGGLALGNAGIARFGRRLARPLRTYAVLELCIGALGLALVTLLTVIGPLLAPLLRPFLDQPAWLVTLRAVTSFALLLVPAAAMGATLPILVGVLGEHDRRFGERLGILYGWNTLGAVVGAVLGEGLLIERIGILQTGFVAAAINVAAAAAAWLFPRTPQRAANAGEDAPVASGTSGALEPQSARSGSLPIGSREIALLAASFGSGALLLMLEVVWFRFLLLFVQGTNLAFSLMLATVLAGIGLGGLAASFWMRRQADAPVLAPLVALIAGALCVRGYAGFESALAPYRLDLVTGVADIALLAARLMLPVAFLSGVLFPLLGAMLEARLREPTRAAGLLTLSNTVGAMLGPLLAGFVLLPAIGVERSLFGLSAGYAGVALVAAFGTREALPLRVRLTLYGGGAILVALLALFPFGAMAQRYLRIPFERYGQVPDTHVAATREGTAETLLYLRTDRFGDPLSYRMMTNGVSMSGTGPAGLRYMRFFVQLPVALHPQMRSALLISYGVGNTARALADTRSLETIDVVDISRDVLELGRIVFPDPAEHPLNDPRVRVHVEDGRYFLQTTDRRFDLITGEPPPPKNAGIASLYTQEYFELVRDRLTEGGIVTYWLPVHSLEVGDAKSIIRAFCNAFENCSLWNGASVDWVLMGSRGEIARPTEEAFARQWSEPAAGAALRDSGFEAPEQLGATFMADAAGLSALAADAPPVTDDMPARISSRGPVWASSFPVFLAWTNAQRCREAFRQSAYVERLWPPALRERTLESFEDQRLASELLLAPLVRSSATLGDLHRLLSTSTLETLPLWFLFSDPREQRIASRAEARGERSPALDTVLAKGAIARRDYAEAADRLTRADTGGAADEAAFYRVYALCLAGRVEEARRSAELVARRTSDGADATDFWDWIERLCGVRPGRSGAAPAPSPGAARPAP
jgi:spermidine synthase